MHPNSLAAMITSLAIAFTEGITADESALLGAALAQLGDTITTISIQKLALEKGDNNQKTNGNQQIPQ